MIFLLTDELVRIYVTFGRRVSLLDWDCLSGRCQVGRKGRASFLSTYWLMLAES